MKRFGTTWFGQLISTIGTGVTRFALVVAVDQRPRREHVDLDQPGDDPRASTTPDRRAEQETPCASTSSRH